MDALFRLGKASAADVRSAMPEPPSYAAVRLPSGFSKRRKSSGTKKWPGNICTWPASRATQPVHRHCETCPTLFSKVLLPPVPWRCWVPRRSGSPRTRSRACQKSLRKRTGNRDYDRTCSPIGNHFRPCARNKWLAAPDVGGTASSNLDGGICVRAAPLTADFDGDGITDIAGFNNGSSPTASASRNGRGDWQNLKYGNQIVLRHWPVRRQSWRRHSHLEQQFLASTFERKRQPQAPKPPRYEMTS